MLIYGGVQNLTGDILGDLWRIDLGDAQPTWALLTPTSAGALLMLCKCCGVP